MAVTPDTSDAAGGDTIPAPWTAAEQAHLREQRAEAFRDLLALVEPRPAMRVVDLGCGPGVNTRALHEHLAARETLGLDRSPRMLARAAALAGGGVRFAEGDARAWYEPAAWDLVFSNSALHWVEDHPRLFAHLHSALLPGGQLAVQVPANFDHPSHAVADELAREEPYCSALNGFERRWPILSPEAYALLLHQLGFVRRHVRLQVYLHLLPSREHAVAWLEGSRLAQFDTRMEADLFGRFREEYRRRLTTRLPDLRPLPYAFKRILVWGALG